MKKIFKSLIFIIILLVSFNLLTSDVNGLSKPVNTIFTNPGEDSNKEMRISYHINLDKSGSYVLYTEKEDVNWANAKKVYATEVENTAFVQLNAIGEKFKQCSVELTDLKKGTHYMYKACLEDYESEIHYFKTGDQDFSFIWTSDFHAYYDHASRLNNATANILEAIKLNNGVDFVLSTGDTIAHGGTYKWWEQLSGASWIQDYMYADTLGNHDWMTSSGTLVSHGASHSFFDAVHNNPKNGYDGQKNVCFYFYYGDALFISLNTEEFTQAQYDWCEDVLKNSEAQYKFIFQHYQMINTSGNFNSAGYERWYKLCDKYGVDIAFSGNSHVYVRTKSIYDHKLSEDSSKGTVYMVAPSSDGDRGVTHSGVTNNKDLIPKSWADGTYTVACSIVSVNSDYISVRLVNKGGEVIDRATILPKRGVSSRITKDISEFNKEDYNKDFRMSVNNSDLSMPYFNYTKGAHKVVKNVIITDKLTNQEYYNGSLDETGSRFKLENFPIRKETELVFTICYWDNEIETFEETFISRKNPGSISNFKVSNETEENINLTWSSTLKEEEVKSVEVLVNGDTHGVLDIKTTQYSLPLEVLKANDNIISLKVVSVVDSVIEIYNLDYFYEKEVAPILLEQLDIRVDDYDKIYENSELEIEIVKTPVEAEDEIEWIISDKSIAVVEGGKIRFLKEGKVSITLRSKENNSISKTIEFEVEKEEAEEQITPEPNDDTKKDSEKEKSGCFGGSIQTVWTSLSALGLIFIIRKRYEK